MQPLEIIALVLVIITFLKLLIISVKQRAWYKFTKAIYSRPAALRWISLILAVIVGYYVIQELSITQIWAVIAFVVLLMTIGVAEYSTEMLELAEKIFRKKNVLKRARLAVAIWVVLGLWLLKELFL